MMVKRGRFNMKIYKDIESLRDNEIICECEVFASTIRRNLRCKASER